MSVIDSDISDLYATLRAKCPHFMPNILPSYIHVRNLADLFQSEKLKVQYNEWLQITTYDSLQPIFYTELDYAQRVIEINRVEFVSEIDRRLLSLEEMMHLMVAGDANESAIYMQRFLHLNGYAVQNKPLSHVEERKIFNDVYNIAYAIKIAIRYRLFRLY